MMDDGGRVMQITSNGSDNTDFSGFSWQGLCGAASTAPTPVMLVNKLILFTPCPFMFSLELPVYLGMSSGAGVRSLRSTVVVFEGVSTTLMD